MSVPLYALAICSATIAVGALAIYLVRVSRRQQDLLRDKGFDHWLSAKEPSGVVESLRVMAFGPQPRAIEVLFRLVTIATALVLVSAVGALFIFVGIQIWRTSG